MKPTKEMIVVLGLDDKQKPHAARFDLAQAEAVRKAAALMSFRTAIPKAEQAVALADRLPPGKLFSSGKGMVAFAKAEVYAKLLAALELEAVPDSAKASPALSKSPEGPQAPGVPTKAAGNDPWADLKVGDTVLAEDGPDGFWPAVITAVSKDTKSFSLRWTVGSNKQPFNRKRRAVGILSNG